MNKALKKLLIGGLAVGGLAAVYAATRNKDAVSIVLKENLTEGYLWNYMIETDGVIKELSSDYLPTFSDSETGESYGEHKWTFAPVSAGETLVKFSYVRPWESEEEPRATATYRFTVDDNRKTTAELVEHTGSFNDYVLSVG